MNVAAVIKVLQVILTELPGAVTTADQLVELGSKFMKASNGTAPTAQEIVDMRAAIDEDVAEALSPLPPAQPGDPDYRG